MHRKIESDLARAAKADAQLRLARFQVQNACKHANVAECPYEPSSTFSYAQSPKRICLDCGLVETGYLYGVLRAPRVYMISRNELYALRQGQISAEQQDSLARNTCTVEDVLREVHKIPREEPAAVAA